MKPNSYLIPRRSVLKGVGASLAIPMLEIMSPAISYAATKKDQADPIPVAFVQKTTQHLFDRGQPGDSLAIGIHEIPLLHRSGQIDREQHVAHGDLLHHRILNPLRTGQGHQAQHPDQGVEPALESDRLDDDRPGVVPP